MNKTIWATVVAMIIAAGMYSCKKDAIKDTEKPAITLDEPLMNDTTSLAVEDSVHIQFSASDNIMLKKISVNITNAGGANVYSYTEQLSSNTYAFHKHFHPLGITKPTPFTLKIDAWDNASNVGNSTVTFYVEP